jgi:hypothetical protein
MKTIIIKNVGKAKEILKVEHISLNQEVHVSHDDYANFLLENYKDVFALKHLDKESKKPDKNKMLTKDKVKKIKTK